MTFPAGETAGWSRVHALVPVDGGQGVVVNETPFHPLDPAWTDQPGDTGMLRSDGLELRVVDSVTGAVRDGEVFLGGDVPVPRGTPGWLWIVVHVVERPVPVAAGVRLSVDAERRRALSAGHTGSHLMALALNGVLGERWKTPPVADPLGAPDFDRAAVTRSRIVPHGSVDTYDLAAVPGLATDGLDADLPELAVRMERRMVDWIAEDARVTVRTEGAELGARRHWVCALSDGRVSLACGGTHVRRLGELGGATVMLERNGDELVVETRTALPEYGHG